MKSANKTDGIKRYSYKIIEQSLKHPMGAFFLRIYFERGFYYSFFLLFYQPFLFLIFSKNAEMSSKLHSLINCIICDFLCLLVFQINVLPLHKIPS